MCLNRPNRSEQMEIMKIIPSGNKLWEQVWRLYVDSFPEWERRRISSHSRASEDDDFHTYISIENGNLQGLVFYWEHDSVIYVEHLAVNPLMRGKGIGSQIIKGLMEENPESTFILEIDPPLDDISKRRSTFYERLGFIANDFDYIHPSYTKNGKPHELRIMSYPKALSNEEFERFKEYLATRVMKYID